MTSAAAEVFCSNRRRSVRRAISLPIRIEFGLRPCAIRARGNKHLVASPFMHFGFYLMIIALVLMGLEAIYSLYQLANFVL
jgi:hypothetical protein